MRYLWFLILVVRAGAASLNVTDLRCEYRVNPLGIDVTKPRLSWHLTSSVRGQRQTAYEIRAGSSAAALGRGETDVWDSGKVSSGDSIQIAYEGPPLWSGQRVFWQARAWDQDGRASPWSRVGWWEMAMLSPADWRASWVTRSSKPLKEQEMFDDHPAPMFRKEFSLDRKLKRARLYVSGLGYYEARLNGRRIGDQLLAPGWTSYAHRVLYDTYDVTDQLVRGRNALGIMLGNGWFNPLPLRMWNHYNLRDYLTIGQPQFILQLQIEFSDGTAQTVSSDATWNVADGPILRNSVYLGEVYDARREIRDWDQAGLDDSRWEPAIQAEQPLGRLRAEFAPPIRVTRTFTAVKVTEPKPGVQIFDLGQNFSGWVRLRVKGPAGSQARLRYGELLYPDGTLNGMTSVCGQIKNGGPGYRYDGLGAPKTAWQQDTYILKGGGEETYVPRFTFHGFRYVEVTTPGASPLALEIRSLQGLALNSDVAIGGSFECSNKLFNRIQHMVVATELSNLFSVESDCPHREKFGYGGDMVAASGMALFNFDMSRFYAKAVEDLSDAVRPNGGFTETAPFVGISSDGLGGEAGPIGWATAQPFLQWELYQFYGDRRLLEEQYGHTKHWIDFLQSCARDNLLDNGISDHESLASKPRALTGTAFYYLNVQLFARIARVLNRIEDAEAAEALSDKIKAAFNRRFLIPGTGHYDISSQACQAFALRLGLVPSTEQTRALGALVGDIQDAHQDHLTTGIFGTRFMLEALTEYNRAGVAYAMVNQRTFPGWGYMLDHGATTLWEHWEFSDNTYSHNHPMFGSVSEWFYRALAGINLEPEGVGFDRIILRPQPVGDLRWVKAGYDSVHGRIVSEWSRAGERFNFHLRLPVGVSATVFLPATTIAGLTEGGRPLARAQGVEFQGLNDHRAILKVGSGDYRFESAF